MLPGRSIKFLNLVMAGLYEHLRKQRNTGFIRIVLLTITQKLEGGGSGEFPRVQPQVSEVGLRKMLTERMFVHLAVHALEPKR